MELKEKLEILADSAKYDVSCSSSGSDRKNPNGLGNGHISGICHSFTSDGRCVSLLKMLMTNICIFDCKYCVNRRSNKRERTIMSPEEIATITMNFYKRNYIEGLFLSSGVYKSADYTMELMMETVKLLRNKYHFNGYIHIKGIPGCSKELLDQIGYLVDRVSINIELPTGNSLKLLAPDKKGDKIINAMSHVSSNIKEKRSFVRAGQTTQMIIGATQDTDSKILSLTQNMYDKFNLKRVYYSAYIPINHDSLLPTLEAPPLKRENRLYQADWLLRFYGFKANELLDEGENFNVLLDPKANYALKHLDMFPVEINDVSYKMLLRVPGIGVTSAKKIIASRKYTKLNFETLKKIGVVMKRAKYFITVNGRYYTSSDMYQKDIIYYRLTDREQMHFDLSV